MEERKEEEDVYFECNALAKFDNKLVFDKVLSKPEQKEEINKQFDLMEYIS
jgi:hypothetical protein